MTSVTIRGCDTRAALEAALWHGMRRVVDPLGDDLSDCAKANMRSEHGFDEAPTVVKDVQGKLLHLEWLQRDLRTVRESATGGQIDVDRLESISAQDLCESLRACRNLIEDWEEIWGVSKEKRRVAIWRRDATVEMLEELSAAEAVA